MAVSASLTQAIFAMDAYNRVVDGGDPLDAGLFITENNLGTAVRLDFFPQSQALAAGFFATAYELDGKTIISYRGTDFGTGDWIDLAGGSLVRV